MGYKVFLSHSTHDWGLVISLSNLLSQFGIEVAVAEWYLTPGEQISQRIFQKIKECDCVVVLLTKNGMRSKWVQQEIGHGLSMTKPIIPLVEKGTVPEQLGHLQNYPRIEYDPFQPQDALLKTSTFVKSLKLKKEEQEKALLVAGGLIAFLLLLAGSEK